MKKRAILALILALCLVLSACGEKKQEGATELNKGDVVYQALSEGQDISKLESGNPSKIYIGYEATDGYLAATLTDEEQIDLVTTSFKKLTVGEKTDDNMITYYPARSIQFDFDGDTISYYFADDDCFVYDSKADVLTYYQLENHEEFFTMFDILIIANNEDAFSDNYLVYDDSSCKASITNYTYDAAKETFNVHFDLNNESEESRIFYLENFTVNGQLLDSTAVFVIDKASAFAYQAPLAMPGIAEEDINDITFDIRVTNDFENPSYEYFCDTVSLVPGA